MSTTSQPDITDRFVTSYIQRTAQMLVNDGVYPPGDLDDLVQELTLELWQRLPNFQPEKGKWSTFVKKVVRDKAASLCRLAQAQRRGGQETIGSLDIEVLDDDELLAEVGDLVREDQAIDRRHVESISEHEAIELRLDVDAVVERLPADLQALARRLKHESISQIARDMQVPRSTIASRVRKLREYFTDAGLAPQHGPRRRAETTPDAPLQVAAHPEPEENPVTTDYLIEEPAEVYHTLSGEYLSSHLLADFRKCPLLYQQKRLKLIGNEDRPAYVIGRALHTLVLEGEKTFDAEFAVGGPINPKTGQPFGNTTKAFQEWQDQHGKTVLTDQQYVLIASMAASVRGHMLAAELLREGVAERVVRADYQGVPCQIRMDWFNPQRGLVDLKTCDDLTWFEADSRRFGYAHQLAFYRAVLALKVGSPMPVHLIAVEKREPYRCGVWRLSDNVLAIAQQENEAAIRRLLNCQATDDWPTGYEEPRLFDAA